MISVCHPSRGRPALAFAAYQNWVSKAVDKNIQWILSLDADDPKLEKYHHLFNSIPSEPLVVSTTSISLRLEIIIKRNTNLIQAVNHCIPYIKGDLVVVVSDDFDCPDKWDELMPVKQSWGGQFEVDGRDYADTVREFAIYINDGISFGRKCMTLPILSKSLIDKLGYIYHPDYTGMFVDDDLYLTCEKMGVVITKDILFQHKHWVNGMAEKDDTYNRHNNSKSWDHGKALLERRKREGFGV